VAWSSRAFSDSLSVRHLSLGSPPHQLGWEGGREGGKERGREGGRKEGSPVFMY
jgi:hypothetical protein